MKKKNVPNLYNWIEKTDETWPSCTVSELTMLTEDSFGRL